MAGNDATAMTTYAIDGATAGYFCANVLVGVLAPILVMYVMMVGNNRTIMHNEPLGLVTNLFLVGTVVALVAADLLFFYGVVTAQGG